MQAVDTNILIRLLTSDDVQQTEVVKALFAAETVWISKTVVLETVWVLRNLYDLRESRIIDELQALLGLDNVLIEDSLDIAEALRLAGHGLELEDALHVCSTPPGTSFLTFDRALIRAAHRVGTRIPVSEPRRKS